MGGRWEGDVICITVIGERDRKNSVTMFDSAEPPTLAKLLSRHLAA